MQIVFFSNNTMILNFIFFKPVGIPFAIVHQSSKLEILNSLQCSNTSQCSLLQYPYIIFYFTTTYTIYCLAASRFCPSTQTGELMLLWTLRNRLCRLRSKHSRNSHPDPLLLQLLLPPVWPPVLAWQQGSRILCHVNCYGFMLLLGPEAGGRRGRLLQSHTSEHSTTRYVSSALLSHVCPVVPSDFT